MIDDAEIGLLSYGISARAAKEAVLRMRDENIKVGLIQLYSIWPFPQKVIYDLSKNLKKLYSVEMNLGQLTDVINSAIKDLDIRVESINRVDGELITPTEIIQKIKEG